MLILCFLCGSSCVLIFCLFLVSQPLSPLRSFTDIFPSLEHDKIGGKTLVGVRCFIFIFFPGQMKTQSREGNAQTHQEKKKKKKKKKKKAKLFEGA
jgi:hypothetical protein